MTHDPEIRDLRAMIRTTLAADLRDQARSRGLDGATLAAWDRAADELDRVPLTDQRLAQIAATWTRPVPDGVDSIVIDTGPADWLKGFDPREDSIDGLLDAISRFLLVVEVETAREAVDGDETTHPGPAAPEELDAAELRRLEEEDIRTDLGEWR